MLISVRASRREAFRSETLLSPGEKKIEISTAARGGKRSLLHSEGNCDMPIKAISPLNQGTAVRKHCITGLEQH